MKKYDIVTGIYNPHTYSPLSGKKFKFIARFKRKYGRFKGQWVFDFYETEEGARIQAETIGINESEIIIEEINDE